jgi:serine/threonine protein kinase
MEYFSENSLRKCLNERETLSEGEIKTVIKQIAEALSFLHKEGLAHRDIKMENILVDEELNIKIIDFGFAVESRETA